MSDSYGVALMKTLNLSQR